MKKKITDEVGKQIIDLYKSGKSTRSIGLLFNINSGTIYRYLDKQKVIEKRRGYSQRKVSLNETVFNEINEESAYWIGFLMADGCVTFTRGKTYAIQLGLSSVDLNHLIKFKSFLGSGHKLQVKENKSYIAVFSKILYNKLSKFGVVPRKSLTAKVSEDLAFNRHFWRGVIDGDGSVGVTSKKRPIIQLAGSVFLLEQFREFCIKNDIKTKAKVFIAHGGYGFKLSHKKAIQCLKLLYEKATIFLDRKCEKAIKLIEAEKTYPGIRKGEDANNVKLKEEEVKEIIKLLKVKRKQKEIAIKFKVDRQTIWRINKGDTWKHINRT